MGWKVSALIISKRYSKPVTELTNELQLGESAISGHVLLSEALYPDHFCIGFHKECTIITHAAILNSFFNAAPSKIEQTFCKLFPDAEMIVAGQIENAGINGFSYIKNRRRIRTLLEGEEEGTVIDTGAPLSAEENTHLYDLPLAIPKMLLGSRLDDDEMLRTKMYALKNC